MSLVSTSHNVTFYTASKSEALTGQRLVLAKYKSTDKTPAKYPSICASIPRLADTLVDMNDLPGSLFPHILEWLETKQDAVFKTVYESKLGELSSIHDDEIGMSAVLGYMNAVTVSGRLTKESIESWFKQDMDSVIRVTAAVKKGFISADAPDGEFEVSEAQNQELNKVSLTYKELFSGLAGGATKYTDSIQGSLTRMLSLCAETAFSERLIGRLESMKESKEFSELL